MKLSIVVAVSENGVIGRDGGLPWKLPDEQRAVKELTWGHCLVMGRRTWDSIGRALPGRTSIVISRDPGFAIDDDAVVVANDLDSALAVARERGETEAFVFGGAAIYELALPRADALYLTRVHTDVEGKIRFPQFDSADWKLVDEQCHEADARHAHAFTMQRWQRI